MRFPIACLVVLAASADISFAAEATTYAGTIGKLPIIIELKSPDQNGAFVGRYAYISKGVDIPLHGADAGQKGKITLQEEKPCTDKLCKNAAGDILDIAPISAEWALTAEGDGARLIGTWRDKETGKQLPVALERKGKRELEDGSDGFDAIDPSYVTMAAESPAVITAEDLPYDFLKMAWPFKQGTVTNVGDSAYRMDEDGRTGLSYPTVVKLGNEDPAPLNAYLLQQRLQLALPAFSCLMKSYLGFGWSGQEGESSTGYDGGDMVLVEHFTPRLMGLNESGSYYCGGAHPSNFTDHRLADAKTGEALAPESLLRGWLAKNAEGKVVDPSTVDDTSELTYGPSEDLLSFVAARRQKFDDDTEKECGMDELVRSNLGVYFTGDSLVFTLRGLPHVIFACTNDLLTVPLKDARPLLTDAGAQYFAVLDR